MCIPCDIHISLANSSQVSRKKASSSARLVAAIINDLTLEQVHTSTILALLDRKLYLIQILISIWCHLTFNSLQKPCKYLMEAQPSWQTSVYRQQTKTHILHNNLYKSWTICVSSDFSRTPIKISTYQCILTTRNPFL